MQWKLKKQIINAIKSADEKSNQQLEEMLRQQLITIGETVNDMDFVNIMKTISLEGIIYCLHLGFSEKAFLESLMGIIVLKRVKVQK